MAPLLYGRTDVSASKTSQMATIRAGRTDLVVFQTSRVAGSVQLLVMLKARLRDGVGHAGSSPQYFITLTRVSLHHCPLFSRERPGLGQDRGGDTNLPDIVQ